MQIEFLLLSLSADQLSYSLAMDVNSYLTMEESYTPWAASLNNLEFINKMFSRTGDYGALKASRG